MPASSSTDMPASELGLSPQAGDPSSPTAPAPPPIAEDRALVHQPDEVASSGFFSRIISRLRLRNASTLREDLSEALQAGGTGDDTFSPEERAMLANILRLREKRVEDVMVPRAQIHALDQHTTLGDVLRCFEETGHSRLPVYEENLDDPRGMVLIKDVMLHMTLRAAAKKGREGLDLTRVDLDAKLSDANIVRRVLFVPPSMLAADLMARMQATRTQMALVIDEYGGTDGLVSLEDIVEEVVGEIEDEHDLEDGTEPRIEQQSDGAWLVDARMELDKVVEELGEDFDPGDLADDVDTLGGLVFALAGTVPVRGEVVRGDSANTLSAYEFRVMEADPRRVRRVRIVKTSARDKRRRAAASTLAPTPPAADGVTAYRLEPASGVASDGDQGEA